jgi:hypothetical protein
VIANRGHGPPSPEPLKAPFIAIAGPLLYRRKVKNALGISHKNQRHFPVRLQRVSGGCAEV